MNTRRLCTHRTVSTKKTRRSTSFIIGQARAVRDDTLAPANIVSNLDPKPNHEMCASCCGPPDMHGWPLRSLQSRILRLQTLTASGMSQFEVVETPVATRVRFHHESRIVGPGTGKDGDHYLTSEYAVQNRNYRYKPPQMVSKRHFRRWFESTTLV